MGPKTATRSTDETSTQPISPAGAEPCIRPRTTVARWVIGLTSTTAYNHPGIVFGSTKMLLTNISGNISIMLTPATEFGVRRIRLLPKLSSTLSSRSRAFPRVRFLLSVLRTD